jgi:transcriptional regulator
LKKSQGTRLPIPEGPPARSQTLRQALVAELRQGWRSAYELSAAVSIREREVFEHLAHLEKSLARGDERLIVEPARCAGCGFTFDKRERLTRPSRCPRCKAERVEAPRFAIAVRSNFSGTGRR